MPALALDRVASATLEAPSAFVLVVDAQGAILLANPALQRFTGRSRDELLGTPFWQVVTLPQETELARAGLAMVMAGGAAIPGEVDWLNADGEKRGIELQIDVLHGEDDRPYAVSFVGIDVTVHREREARARALAMTDALTGVANRSALFAVLGAWLSPESGDGVGLLFCDLDDFKPVNDRYGHNAGDRVLVAIADRLRELAGPEDVVARLGGDEFVLVVPGADDEVLAARAELLEDLMEVPFSVRGDMLRIGISTGTAIGRPGDDADEVMTRADMEMYGVQSLRRTQAMMDVAG